MKFSYLSRMGSTILSTHPGLSSTVLNFSPEVTCPWFSLVIVQVLQSLCQQLGVWWLKGRRSQVFKTSGFSNAFFFPECWQTCFPLSSLRLVVSAWTPCMHVVTHDLYSRMKITSHEKKWYRWFTPSFLRISKKSVFSDYGLCYSWSKQPFILAQIVSGYVNASKSHISAFFPGTRLRIFFSPDACGWFSDSARRMTGLSWQPVACCEKRWCQMTSFWLFITPRWVMFPKLDRLVWFIITCPSGLPFCCICFWDSSHASCNGA